MNSSPHGGKAARDALEHLALSLDAGAFVDVDARAVHLRRTRDDAVGECLRNYQLCASCPEMCARGSLAAWRVAA